MTIIFMTQPVLQKRFDCVARQSGFRAKTHSEWKTWRTTTRKKLNDVLGMQTFRFSPLRPNITEEGE